MRGFLTFVILVVLWYAVAIGGTLYNGNEVTLAKILTPYRETLDWAWPAVGWFFSGWADVFLGGPLEEMPWRWAQYVVDVLTSWPVIVLVLALFFALGQSGDWRRAAVSWYLLLLSIVFLGPLFFLTPLLMLVIQGPEEAKKRFLKKEKKKIKKEDLSKYMVTSIPKGGGGGKGKGKGGGGGGKAKKASSR